MENEASKAEAKDTEVSAEKKAVSSGNSLVMKIRNVKLSKTTRSFVIVFGVFLVLLGVAYYFKGVFVAATVNGEPISRLSIVRELEKRAGKNALDTMVTKKLISDEVKKRGITVKKEDIDAEIKKISDQIAAQGGTLEQALSQQGMTESDLLEQITLNKQLEQVLSDKVSVSDEEITSYLAENKILPTKGVSSEDLKNQTREQLKGQKFNTAAAQFIEDLRAKATINYFVQY